MNEAQHLANAHLHALAEAYQHGRIGRDEYRARRRNVLASVRDIGQGVTHRNALRPTVAAAAPAATRAAHEPLRALFADTPARRRLRWLILFIFVTLIAFLLLFFAGALPAFAGQAQAAADPGPRAHRSAAAAAVPGAQWGEAGARQGIVPGEIACV